MLTTPSPAYNDFVAFVIAGAYLIGSVPFALILARPDLEQKAGADAIEEAFRYADEGELCALYRALAHVPEFARFAWRAKEGCRTNMVSVFEANVIDTPLPAGLAPGQRAMAREGCDYRLDTCAARFGNAANFQGEPFLPGNDLLTRYPVPAS